MEDIEVNGQKYRIGKLDVFTQFHVVRRLAGVLAGVGSAFRDEAGGDFLSAVGPLSQAIGAMSDADSEYVLKSCLGVVTRAQGNTYARITAANGSSMFEDIDLPVLLFLVWRVLEKNLKGFSAVPGLLSAGAQGT